MQLTITGRHIEIPPMLEELFRSKVDKMERFGHNLNAVHAIFGRQKYLYTAEITLSAKGMGLVGRATHPKDFLTCMEEALSKLEAQLKRRERKRLENLRRRTPHRPA